MKNVNTLKSRPIRKKESQNVPVQIFIPKDVEERRFKAREIYAWVQASRGVAHERIATDLDLSRKQVGRYIQKIDETLKDQFPIEKYQELCFYANIYQALDNVGWLLAIRDPQMTTNFLKGMGVFKEFVHETGDRIKLSRADLEKRLRELSEDLGVGSGNGTASVTRLPKTAFSENSPQHEGGGA